MSATSSLEWADIIEKYNIKCHYDSLRKASQTIFGGYFVSEYLKYKGYKNDSTKNLDDARELLGEQYIVKQQIHNDRLKLNKLKRDLVPCLSVADEMKEFLVRENLEISIPKYCHYPIHNDSMYTMVLPISDWHIGSIINNCDGNYFNWDIANNRVDEYISWCKKYIHMYDIKKVIVINCGDTVENTYMRNTQDKECEFLQSEQINKAIKIIYRFLVALSEDCNVIYGGIAGNHDRMSGDIKKAYEGDNVNVIINEQLKTYAELSNNNRLSFIDTSYNDKEIRIDINGVSCKFVHGDDYPKLSKNTMASMISSDNELYDLLVFGHWHNFYMNSENNGRYVIGNGCLSGRNTYSKKFFCSSNASQTIIIVGNGEIELVKDVNLGNIQN